MASERKIHIGTELDTSGMLAGINEMRQLISGLSVDSNLFKDVTKDLDKMSKLTISIASSLKNGVPEKELNTLLKDLSSVGKISSTLPDKIRQISIQTNNIRFPTETLNRLDEIERDIERLGQEAKNALGSDLRKALRDAVPTTIISNRTLDNILKAKNVTGAFEDELVKVQSAAQKADKELDKLMTGYIGSNDPKLRGAGKLLSDSVMGGTLAQDRDRLANLAAGDLSKTDYNAYVTAMDKYIEAQQKSLTLEQEYANLIQIVQNSETTAAEKAEQITNLRAESQQIINKELEKNLNVQKQAATVAEQAGAKISSSTEQAADSVQKANTHLQRQDSLLKQIASRATSLIGIGAVFNYITRGIRDAWNGIKDLDKEFTQIAVVTDKTTSQLWNSYGTYSQMAQGLGVATKDAVATSALYYQQGLDTADVMTLTAETIKMAQIAGMDFATATNQMTAAIRGFNLEMNQASMVNDIFSTLAANAAVSTQELSYALTKTASIAESAGMSIDTTSAFLTKMIETTREAPENIGTAMKSIVARFEELKKNPLALTVDVDGEEVVANKVEAAIALAGVKLRDAGGQFRDLDDVFLELAKSWDGLDRNTQRYIATIAAGSRQQSRFIALMDGYDRTLELTEIAQDSEGQSVAQFLKTLDSLDSKLNRVGNSLEQLYQKFVNSDFFGGLIDSLNDLLQKLGKMDAGQLATFVTAGILIGNNLIRGFTSAIKNSSAFILPFQKKLGEIGSKAGDIITKVPVVGNVANKLTVGHRQEVINKKIGARTEANKQQIIKVDADISKAEQKIDNLKNDLQNLENQKRQVEIDVALTQNDDDKAELNNLNNSIIQKQEDINIAKGALQQSQEAREALLKEGEVIQQDLALQSNNIKQSIGQSMQAVGGAMITSLSLGITTALATEDPLEALGAAMGSFALQVLPAWISMVGAQLTAGASSIGAAVTAAGGPIFWIIAAIGAAVIGLGVLITSWAKNSKSESEKLQNTLNELNERKKALEEESERSQAEYSVKKIENKNLEKLINNYDKLIHKTNRTTEENEKLDNVISDLAKDFPDLVKYYDEAGNAVLKQRQEWEKIVEKQKESAKIALGKSASDELEIALNDREIAETELKRNKTEQKDWLNSGVIRGYDEENMTTKGAIDYISNRSDINSQVEFLTGLYQGSDNMFKNIIANMAINLDKTSEDFNNLLTELTKLDENQQLDKITEYFGLTEELKNQYIEGVGDNLVQFINELKNIGELNAADNKYEKAVANEKDHVRELIANQTIEFIDNLGKESSQYSGKLKGYVSKGLNNKKAYQDLEKVTLNPQSGAALSEIKRIAEDNSTKISLTKLNNLDEVVNHHKDDENLNLNDEEKKTLQAVVEELRTELYTQLAESATDGLKAIEEKLSEEDFELINSEDWGNVGLDKLKEIKNSIFGFDENTAGEIDKYITEVSNKYTGVFDQIANTFGDNVTQKLIDNKTTDQIAQKFLKIFDGMEASKAAGIMEVINNPQTDLGNLDQLKQLAGYFINAGDSAEEATDHVLELKNALTHIDINNDLSASISELGESTKDIQKNFSDLNSAIKEYKENGRLSAETVLELINAGQAQYLMYDELNGAVKINAELVEKAWKEEINAARAKLQISIEEKKQMIAALQLEIGFNNKRIKLLEETQKSNYTITKKGYEDLLKLENVHAINETNGQIAVEDETLRLNRGYFEQFFEDSKQSYQDLIQLASQSGSAIREALMSGISGNGDSSAALAMVTQTLTNSMKDAPSMIGLTSGEVTNHLNEMLDSYNLHLDPAATEEAIKYYKEQNQSLQELANTLQIQIDEAEELVTVYDKLYTNRSMAEVFDDTAKATKNANEELKKYISSLERFYNLNKEIEEVDRKQSKAKKAFEKDRSLENGQAYLDATVEKGALGLKKKKSGEEQEKKDRGYARDEFKELLSQKGIKLSPEGFDKLFEKFNMQEGATGQLDQRAFKQWLIEQKNAGKVTYDNAQDIENLFKEWLGLIDDDLKMQIDGQDQYEESLEEIEDFEDELKEIKEALDPLVAIKAGIEAANKIMERAKEDLEDYYTSGGKQGINIAQYGHTVGSAMNLNDTTLEKLSNYKNSLTADNSELMKYLVDLGEGQWTYDYSTIGQITDKKTIDAVSDLLEKLKEVGETEEDLKKKNKELGRSFQDALKKNRLEYSNLVNRVAQAMADLDQKEIDAVKKKYAMIQEEDDKYLEALQKSIDKQRQLRDQAKSYDDLEKDEKRLALLERDTSGANAAEIAALKEQIKDKRENLVDTEQDNIVNKISEDNKNRKDKMDEETQFLQNVMDERTYDMQYYIEKAYDIVDAAINGDEGAYQRMLEILKKTDAEFYRTTKEGQQIWFESLQESWTHAKDHALAVQTELIENLGKTDSQVHENLTNFAKEDERYASDASNALDTLGNKTNTIDFTKCWNELKTSCEEAKEKINEVLKLINDGPYEVEARVIWNEIGKPSDLGGGGGSSNGATTITDANKKNYKIVTDTSSGKDLGLIDVNSSAYENRVKSQAGSPLEFVDITDLDRANKLQEKNWGQSSDRFKDYKGKYCIVKNEEIVTEPYDNSTQLLLERQSGKVPMGEVVYIDMSGEATDILKKKKVKYQLDSYDLGGRVEEDGLALIHNHEAVLTAKDVDRLDALTEALAQFGTVPFNFNDKDKSEVKAGDTNIEIHIDVEKIEDDYDVEQMLDTIESRISEASKGQVTIVK